MEDEGYLKIYKWDKAMGERYRREIEADMYNAIIEGSREINNINNTH